MRILLAEDEKALSRAVITILTKSGYEAEAAYDGAEALRYLETGDYDALILDVMMPVMDGIEVLRRLRDSGSRIPVLMLTAKAETDDKVLGLDAGANDYLTKPFVVKELLARVRAMTRGLDEKREAPLSMGNISLHRGRLELSSPTGSFRLSAKEFGLMELLLCSRGHVLSWGRLLEKNWEAETAEGEELVRVYISYLTKKLEALHASVRIRRADEEGFVLEEKGV